MRFYTKILSYERSRLVPFYLEVSNLDASFSSYRMIVEKVEAAVALEAQSNLSGEWCTMREGHLFHIPTLLET